MPQRKMPLSAAASSSVEIAGVHDQNTDLALAKNTSNEITAIELVSLRDIIVPSKVDKVADKELTQNDFTDSLLNKLNNIEPVLHYQMY